MERDRRAGGLAFEHAGQDAHRIRFLPLGGEARLAGASPIEPGLDVGFAQRDAWRTAIHYPANRRPMAFTPAGNTEQMAETVVRHDKLGKVLMNILWRVARDMASLPPRW